MLHKVGTDKNKDLYRWQPVSDCPWDLFMVIVKWSLIGNCLCSNLKWIFGNVVCLTQILCKKPGEVNCNFTDNQFGKNCLHLSLVPLQSPLDGSKLRRRMTGKSSLKVNSCELRPLGHTKRTDFSANWLPMNLAPTPSKLLNVTSMELRYSYNDLIDKVNQGTQILIWFIDNVNFISWSQASSGCKQIRVNEGAVWVLAVFCLWY